MNGAVNYVRYFKCMADEIWSAYLDNVRKFVSGNSLDADEELMCEFEDVSKVVDRGNYRIGMITMVDVFPQFNWRSSKQIRKAMIKVIQGRVGTLAASG